MADRPLNRRDFLRLSLVMAGGTLAACQKTQPAPIPTSKGNTPLPQLKAGIQLNGGDADAWTFRKLLKGSLENPAACQGVWINNDGVRVQAMMQDDSFSAEVPIHTGSNSMAAVCQHTNEEEELSNEINFTGRLEQRPTAVINASLSNGRLVLDGAGSLPDELENQPIREYIWSPRPGNLALVMVDGDSGQQEFEGEVSGPSLEVELPQVDGEYYFSLRVIDEAGREDVSTTYVVVDDG